MSSFAAAAPSPSKATPNVANCFTTEAIRLEELLANHGVAARVGQASFSSDAIRFPLQLGLGTTTRRVLGLAHALAREAGYSRCQLRREGRSLFLELPRDEGAGLRYGDLLERSGELPSGSALLGMMEHGGASLMLRLTNPTVRHLLISGDAAIGKSELLRVVGLGIAAHHSARHWRLTLLDSRPRGSLASLRALPHCWAWSEQPEHAVGWLVRLFTEMKMRERDPHPCAQVLALVDEGERVLEAGGPVVRGVLRALLERGAASGIHVALACRSGAALGDELCDLFPARLAAAEGAVPGRFRFQHEQSSIPITTARLDDREVGAVVERIRFGRTRLVARAAGGAA